MSYSLLSEHWLPLLAADGSPQLASLRDALLSPDCWRGVAAVNPTEHLAIYRLLLAICHRAIGPGDAEDRSDLLDAWPSDRIDAYLTEWSSRFDLLDPERPFLQLPDLVTARKKPTKAAPAGHLLEPSPWTRLAGDRANGSGRMLWDHSVDADPEPITLAEAARLLVAHQQFTPGGLVKALRTSGNDAPAVKILLMLPTGDTLQETLALSLVPQTAAQHLVDLPPWEAQLPTIEQLRKPDPVIPAGPAQRYVHLARSVLLLPDGDGLLRQVLYAEGFGLGEAPIPDPMAALVQRKTGPMPLMINADRATWRDYQAMTGGEGTTAPAVIQNAVTVRMDRGEYEPLHLVAGGLLTDQARHVMWRLEERRVHPRLLVQGNAVSQAQSALEQAEATHKALYGAISALFTAWLTKGAGGLANKAELKNLQKSTQVQALYWAALEAPFWSLVEALGDGVDAEVVLDVWHQALCTAVRGSWDVAARSLGDDGRALRAIGATSHKMGGVLAGIAPAETSVPVAA
ncbi:type I-E CRISPR-associated protein Cse1/CasA [Synechococcus sp. J7-Johnson]|uniref:type I-E CRISPR-associated protein Cse1/CasA n=1 Tax=Synechococcus sp. J7-Johnson TaxID=2823737 RepID=UPI0020CB9A2D|nr:type I-E CRISPR-associated protein Cse1/CasA [Synechococcus sp. J7-Johnson]MCP9841741.1 type I-E CRISPR-associated protein Cse1/CasA [Synechococcus sp. J7-Johnson]